MWDRNDTHLGVLFIIASVMNAKKIVELGTGEGISGNLFSEVLALTDGKLYSIEKFPNDAMPSRGRALLSSKDNVILMEGDSVKVGGTWGESVDIVYCNSDHGKEHVKKELSVWGPKAKVLIVHDIFKPNRERGPPYFACEEYAKESGREFIPIDSDKSIPGLGVLI